MTRNTYIWSSEICRERMRLIEFISKKYKFIFGVPSDMGHYTRLHWKGLDALKSSSSDFKAKINGKLTYIKLKIIPLKEWFARCLFLKAIELTQLRHPGFDKHIIQNGTRAGERILSFENNRDLLASRYLYSILNGDIKSKPVHVAEHMTIKHANSWGRPSTVAKENELSKKIDICHMLYTIVVDQDRIDDASIDKYRNKIINGEKIELSKSSKTFDRISFLKGFCELTNPELVVLNWGETQPTHSNKEKELINACEQLDLVGILNCLKSGANPNVFSFDYTPLSLFIDAISNHDFGLDNNEDSYIKRYSQKERISKEERLMIVDAFVEKGYHLDIHAPGGNTSTTEASLNNQHDILEALLRHGADPSIDSDYDTDHYGGWPQAWDSPESDWWFEKDENARKTVSILLKYAQIPYSEMKHALEKMDMVKDLLSEEEYNDLKNKFSDCL